MSKSGELKMLKYGCSIDAPINYHHRSGDSEGSGGSMLDFYAQEESAEEAYLEVREESAREVFSRAFRLYLKKTLTGKELKFLSRVLSGKEKPQEVGRALGVKWFEYMQEIQRKAFNNAAAFGRVVRLSGWSRAQEFADTVFKRFELLNAGAELNEILPQNRRQALKLQKARANNKAYRQANPERVRESKRAWRQANRENERERKRAYRKANRERIIEANRLYREMNREKLRERARAWREGNREKRLEAGRKYHKLHQETRKEKYREYYIRNRAEINAKHRAYYEANKIAILDRQKAHRAKKKAEKEAAKALAGLLILSQTQGAETLESVSTME